MQLPSSWSLVRLSFITTPIVRTSPQQRGDGVFQYIDIASVDNEKKEISIAKSISNRDAPSRARQLTIPGDVLVSTVRPNLNAVALVPDELDGAICSTGFCVLRAKPQYVYAKYLYHWVKSAYFIDSMSALARGAGYPAVSERDVFGSSIPLPPLDEQYQIIAILEKADGLRQIRRATLEQVGALTEALFNELFKSECNRPASERTLGKSSTLITSGSRGWAKYYSEDSSKPYFIRVQNVKNGSLNFEDAAFIDPPDSAEARRAKVQNGDIVVTITGSVGEAAVVDREVEAYISQHVSLVRLNADTQPRFIVDFINSPIGGKSQITRSNYGQTKPGLNLDQIAALRIPDADPTKVKKYIALRERLTLMLREITDNYNMIQSLATSISKSAFAGELTGYVEQRSIYHPGAFQLSKVGPPPPTPQKRAWEQQTHRRSLLNQMSEFQAAVRSALELWEKTLLPSKDMEEFIESAPIAHLHGQEDHIKRALNELAGLGLIARTSIPNERGDYVTAYRGLREDELSRVGDLDAIKRALGDD